MSYVYLYGELIEVHTPRGFDDQLRPHFCKVRDVWGALWPMHASPTEEDAKKVGPFLRHLMGISEANPNSIHLSPPPMMQ